MIFTRAVFSRLLAGVYFLAFLSLWFQLDGLIGAGGILPVSQLMDQASSTIPGRFDLLPTVFWFASSDRFLYLVCGGGIFLAAVAFLGFAEPLVFFLLWACYLSIVGVSGEFLSYQWDNLLLETGFLAIFFAPFRWREKLSNVPPPSTVMVWLLRWLLFRLMLQSGLVKLLSHDPTWASFTALDYHFETQPLPTWIGWYAHHLKPWAHMVLQGVMFAVELVVPFFIFLTRRFRLIAFWLFLFFQIGIALTGNYGFFNLLTFVLGFVLLDDDAFGRFRKERKAVQEILTPDNRAVRVVKVPKRSRLPLVFFVPFAVFIVAVSGLEWVSQIIGRRVTKEPLRSVLVAIAPFRSINRYGLFAVMTTDRPEIIVEGSVDGTEWKPYEFKWKPGDPARRPGFVAPHQPRLDWQMWFAALESCERNPWFTNFEYRLLQGSPPVLDLLKINPFPDKPPLYVRSTVYDYRFTDPETKAADGAWWRREAKGEYCPVLSLPH
ncbi:MAG TPA: lipase maturation factor family protein [bacterium]|nr:lipase maturation factor family protein [bacterium]